MRLKKLEKDDWTGLAFILSILALILFFIYFEIYVFSVILSPFLFFFTWFIVTPYLEWSSRPTVEELEKAGKHKEAARLKRRLVEYGQERITPSLPNFLKFSNSNFAWKVEEKLLDVLLVGAIALGLFVFYIAISGRSLFLFIFGAVLIGFPAWALATDTFGIRKSDVSSKLEKLTNNRLMVVTVLLAIGSGLIDYFLSDIQTAFGVFFTIICGIVLVFSTSLFLLLMSGWMILYSYNEDSWLYRHIGHWSTGQGVLVPAVVSLLSAFPFLYFGYIKFACIAGFMALTMGVLAWFEWEQFYQADLPKPKPKPKRSFEPKQKPVLSQPRPPIAQPQITKPVDDDDPLDLRKYL